MKIPPDYVLIEWVEKGRMEIERYLKCNPKFLDFVDDDRWTPLHFAVASGHISMVELILRYGKFKLRKLNAPAKYDITPLSVAIDNHHIPIIKLVLQCGAYAPTSMNFRNRFGWTTFHTAVATRIESIVELLLQHGGRRMERKLISEKIQHSTVSQTRGSFKEDGWNSFHLAAYGGCDDMMNLLISKCHRLIDSCDQLRQTPLHVAANEGQDSIVKLLLHRGSRALNFRDKYGRTPLHLASGANCQSTVKILRAAGAFIPSSLRTFSPNQISRIQIPIPESERLEIRFQIYFASSLTMILLHFL